MSNDSLKIGVAFTLIVLVAIVVTALHFIDSIHQKEDCSVTIADNQILNNDTTT